MYNFNYKVFDDIIPFIGVIENINFPEGLHNSVFLYGFAYDSKA